MNRITYFGIFQPTPADGYQVYFPDIPGCTSEGTTFATAQQNAATALGEALYRMEKDHLPIPTPLTLTQLPLPEGKHYVSPVTVYPNMVRHERDNRRVKTNITLPVWLKDLAEEQGVNYSRLLEEALREYLELS